VRTEECKLYLFTAIDRTSKFAYTASHDNSNKEISTAFLCNLIEAVPYKIRTILTDNGSQLCHPPRYRHGLTAQWTAHMFDLFCHEQCIEHRLTKPKHPWTNGQVER
jgi:transposase InsO family protein